MHFSLLTSDFTDKSLDVSQWGRFQGIDLSAQLSAIRKKHK
jgi:hypothetical protein